MTSSQIPFFIVWFSLLGAPPIALSAFFLICWKWPHRHFFIVITSAIVLTFSLAFALFRLSFTGILANFSLFSLAYTSYSFLAASCFQIPQKAIRIFALIATAIPICIGYFLATFGVIGLVFILMDFMQQPFKTEQIDTQLVCRMIGWGSAATDSGYGVHLYKTWTYFPFVQKHVAQIIISESTPDSLRKDATCADVMALYESEHR